MPGTAPRRTLGDAEYIEGELQHEGGRSALITHFQVTGRGEQALGEWPLFDQLASPDTLALLLERLAEEAPSDEEARNLRRAASYARGVAGSALRSAAIAALAHVARAHNRPDLRSGGRAASRTPGRCNATRGFRTF